MAGIMVIFSCLMLSNTVKGQIDLILQVLETPMGKPCRFLKASMLRKITSFGYNLINTGRMS